MKGQAIIEFYITFSSDMLGYQGNVIHDCVLGCWWWKLGKFQLFVIEPPEEGGSTQIELWKFFNPIRGAGGGIILVFGSTLLSIIRTAI